MHSLFLTILNISNEEFTESFLILHVKQTEWHYQHNTLSTECYET